MRNFEKYCARKNPSNNETRYLQATVQVCKRDENITKFQLNVKRVKTNLLACRK